MIDGNLITSGHHVTVASLILIRNPVMRRHIDVDVNIFVIRREANIMVSVFIGRPLLNWLTLPIIELTVNRDP